MLQVQVAEQQAPQVIPALKARRVQMVLTVQQARKVPLVLMEQTERQELKDCKAYRVQQGLKVLQA